ncbi:MAG: hypothetical protein AAF335_05195 [Bacteroidota bacterium]
MYLSIFSQEKTIFTGEIKSVQLPGSVAPFQVLKDHAEMISTLEKGTLVYEPIKGNPLTVKVAEGIAKIKDNQVTVLMK